MANQQKGKRVWHPQELKGDGNSALACDPADLGVGVGTSVGTPVQQTYLTMGTTLSPI